MAAADMSAIPNPPVTAQSATHRYDSVQRGLHWLMAVIILIAVAIGLYCSFQVPGTPVRKALLEIHKSLGMTALVLIVFRIAYRIYAGAPAYSRPLGKVTHIAAGTAHTLLYVIMVGMPLTGYLFSAAGGYSLPWFGVFQWPRLLPNDNALAALGEYLNDWGSYGVYAVLVAHIAAVAWHHFVKRDEVLGRMLPSRD